jgi:hypothetical protein
MKIQGFMVLAGVMGFLGVASADDGPRTARNLKHCKDMQVTPNVRTSCVRCVTRSPAREYSLDRPEGQRCVPVNRN